MRLLCHCRLNRRQPTFTLGTVPAHGYIITALLAYLLGSVPTGFLAARAKGVDIRQVGSGNIGATNAFRVLGKGWGVAVLLLDFAKGLLACLMVPPVVGVLLSNSFDQGVPVSVALLAAVLAVLGHNFPIWLRFKGGKGIATSAGVLTALVPVAVLVGLGVWILLFAVTRYSSVGSIGAALALPVATWVTAGGDRVPLTLMTSVLAAMAILKHRTNIQRLLSGTEQRLELGRTRKGRSS